MAEEKRGAITRAVNWVSNAVHGNHVEAKRAEAAPLGSGIANKGRETIRSKQAKDKEAIEKQTEGK